MGECVNGLVSNTLRSCASIDGMELITWATMMMEIIDPDELYRWCARMWGLDATKWSLNAHVFYDVHRVISCDE
jgi:hypothetical protein